MKRGLSIVLALAMLLSVVGTLGVVSTADELPAGLTFIYNNYHNTDNLINPIANVQRVTAVSSANLSNLSVAYFDLTAGIDATSALKACVTAKVVPTFYITTNAQADKIVSAISSAGKYDVNVISNSASVLAYMRNKNSKVRTGLSLDIATEAADGKLTSKEGDSIRKKVRSAPANFIVLDSKYAIKSIVTYLQEYAVAVWINVTATPGTTAFRTQAITALTSGAHGIITSSASAVEEIIAKDFVPNSFTRLSSVIGHAGNYDIAEENTMASFIAAYENGADILELDLGITSDGVPVLLHDNTIWRTTTYKNVVAKENAKNIWEMSWAEVQKYTVVDTKTGVDTGKTIPKFEELLQYCKGKDVKLFVEFKWDAHGMIPGAINLIKKYDMIDQCDFLSFYNNCINSTLAQEAGVSTSRLFFNTADDIRGDNSNYAQCLLTLEHWLEVAQPVKSTIGPARYVPVTNELMQAAADRGATIWPWTYNSSSSNDAFFACVDGMTMVNAQDFKNMVKYVYSDGVSMFVGQTYSGGVTAETYSGSTYSIKGSDTVMSVVSGDAVKLENGKLVAVKEGTAQVIFGCKTTTYMGSEYVIYSQPITVTVGASAGASTLAPLMEIAETATVNSLPEEDLNTLRELYNKAKSLISASNPSESEIKATATAMSELINKFNVVSYTTTAPNYDYWDTASAKMFYDDGVRLMDGKKQKPAGDTSAYSAWKSTSSGVVDITVDYGSAAAKDTFSGYFAYGTWGIYAPSAMDIYYSNDGNSWTKANTTLTTVETKASTTELPWALCTITAKSATAIKARYFRFKVTPGYSNGFIWVDEIELTNSNDTLGYVSATNKKIAEGDAVIFTNSFGAVNNKNANITYTAYVVAKWDSKYNAYIITSVETDNTADKTYNLAKDEIILAVHDWETGLAGQQGVSGSAANRARVSSAKVGQAICFYGINSDWTFSVAPAFEIVDAEASTHTHNPATKWSTDKDNHWHDCNCGEKTDLAPHTAGNWEVTTPATTEKAGEQVKKCTVCGYTLETKEIPKLDEEKPNPNPDFDDEPDTTPEFMLGDVNDSKEIDSMDYVLVKRAYFGTFTFDEDQFKRGDVNKSGEIDSMDYVLVKRAYFGTFSFE